MVTISNFNSVIEVALAINAIFVIFDLLPKMDEQFKESMAMPVDVWEPEMSKDEERYIATYGWRSYVFTYGILRSYIKTYRFLIQQLRFHC